MTRHSVSGWFLGSDEGPTSAATVGCLLPFVSVAPGVVVLGEGLSARVVAGMAVGPAGVGTTRRATAREVTPGVSAAAAVPVPAADRQPYCRP